MGGQGLSAWGLASPASGWGQSTVDSRPRGQHVLLLTHPTCQLFTDGKREPQRWLWASMHLGAQSRCGQAWGSCLTPLAPHDQLPLLPGLWLISRARVLSPRSTPLPLSCRQMPTGWAAPRYSQTQPAASAPAQWVRSRERLRVTKMHTWAPWRRRQLRAQ